MPSKSEIVSAIRDPILVNRFRKVTRSRKYPRDSRTYRELALERLQQIESFGDVPLVPSRHAIEGAVA